MRLSKVTILVLLWMILLAVFFAKLTNVITINYDFAASPGRRGNAADADAATTSGGAARDAEPSLIIGDSADHLMWFVQISDIHVSIFHDPNRISDFRDFCNQTVDAIQPTVVIASGDLADAKQFDNMGSRQFKQEWIYYGDILNETRITERTLWLDIRGNHDNFNVPDINKHKSFYHEFSIQGKRHKRSYMYTIIKGYEKYSFIAVDSCLDPGPRRPLNFIGKVSEEQFQLLEQFEKDSRTSNATVWFGHYPTSCIISPQPGIRDLMKAGTAYLCGHLHTLGGVVPQMYTLQHKGFLELELGDWKENRIYRVAAFDHGLFSFTDVLHGQWPVVLVTNPKHALFGLPHKENSNLVLSSSHIRVLVFSTSPIEVVRAKINAEDWIDLRNVQGPLFVAQWDTKKYRRGLHEIRIYARDQNGRQAEVEQPFSVDGSRTHFRLLPRVALMTNATNLFYTLFIILVISSVAPLVILRFLHVLVKDDRIPTPDLTSNFVASIIRKVWITCTINKLFYPLVLYPIYIMFGPWFIGEVIDDHIGTAFAWGTYVDGKILPGAFSYFYGCVQLFWFHIPFVIVLSHCVDLRFRMICSVGSWTSYTSQVVNNLPCIALLVLQGIFAYFFYLAYGTMALFLGPLRTWSVIMGVYLWYTAATLGELDLVDAKLIWGDREFYNAITHSGHTHEL